MPSRYDMPRRDEALFPESPAPELDLIIVDVPRPEPPSLPPPPRAPVIEAPAHEPKPRGVPPGTGTPARIPITEEDDRR